MSEFSDRPFAAGSLTGIRSFRVDHYGRLQATQLTVVWTPGENIARCLKHKMPSAFTFMFPRLTSIGAVEYDEVPATPPLAAHQVASLNCTCGFYAYFDNDPNPYNDKTRLHGLVEGYGVVTVGTRGFRAEKAKLRALVIPAKKTNASTRLVRGNYPDVPVFQRRRDALAEFPLTPPSVPPSPDSDPDFWTREAL